jgi:enolase
MDLRITGIEAIEVHFLTERLGDRVQLVGDDMLLTNVAFLRRAIREHSCNRHPAD